MQALRKFPRYTPVNGVLYRGIRAHVQTEIDSKNPKTKPYTKGNEKTWWTFTSTTEDLEATKKFIGGRCVPDDGGARTIEKPLKFKRAFLPNTEPMLC